jgi:VCBS repeat-containing protein
VRIAWLPLALGALCLHLEAIAQQSPVAVDDFYSTPRGRELNIAKNRGVLSNDTNPGGKIDDLRAVLVNNVSSGTLRLDADGSFRYTPLPSFGGTDAFTYRAMRGSAPSNLAMVRITVTGVNSAPAAKPDSYTTAEDTQLTVAPPNGVLANDTDANGDTLTAALVSNVQNGTLTLNANGSFVYQPKPDFNGADGFSYRASDAQETSSVATVTIDVSKVNDAPVAATESYQTNESTKLTVNAANGVLANDTDVDGDKLTATLVGNVASGTLQLAGDGSFTYTPNAGFSGNDGFTYRAGDGTATSNTVTVAITVIAVNDPPSAEPDSYSTDEDRALSVDARHGVLANDEDPDDDPLTAALVRNSANGTVALSPSGAFTFTPSSDFFGTTTFAYEARDGTVGSGTTTVTIAVAAVNDPPFITSAPERSVDEHTTYRYTLRASDPDGDALTVAAPVLPAWLAFTPPATITGTPQQKDIGVHSVRLTVTDGIARPVDQGFQITVNEVDDPPVIAAIPDQSATEHAPFELSLAPYVSDPDTPAASLVYSGVGALPPGFSLAAAGVLSGTAQTPSAEPVTIRFTVTDGASTVPGQLRLTVLRAGRVDLSVAVSAAPSPVALDTPAAFTFTITNNARDVEVGAVSLQVVITGEVPFRFGSPTTPGCTAATTENQTTLACTLGALAGGASTSVSLSGSGGLAGDLFASATVAVSGPVPIDETPGNDRATGSLSVAQRVSATPAQEIAGFSARAAAAGDIDADGFDDLAIATESAQGTVLLMNVVDPAKPSKRALATTPQALGGTAVGNDVAMADLDRDGDVDIVTASAAGSPSAVFVNNAGNFASAPLDDGSRDNRAVALGDVNGDSFTDLVLANAAGSSIFVNRGSGAAFTRSGTAGSRDARDVILVDLFGDPLPELVVANGDGDAEVYRNTGGSLRLETTLATGPTTSVAAADFDGDGKNDLVFGRDGAVTKAPPSDLVWLNSSSTKGQFVMSQELGRASTASLLLGDFDIDGDADILAVSRDGEHVYSNVGAANGGFALAPVQLDSAGPRMAVAGRLSVDDRVDVAVVGGSTAVFYNDGSGNLGLGDTAGPTIQLRGEATATVIVGEPYTDAGATAMDAVDGDVSSRIKIQNAVDPAVIGTYNVTYSATDLSGNEGTPATRTVRVQTREATGGGGGGSFGLESLAWLALALLLGLRSRGRMS